MPSTLHPLQTHTLPYGFISNFSTGAQAGKISDLLRNNSEKSMNQLQSSAAQWFCVIQRKKQQTPRTVQETNRKFLIWNGSGQKYQNTTWKADTGTNEPAPTDPFQWKFCSRITLLLINSSEPKILFAHGCCQKAKYAFTVVGWGHKVRLSLKKPTAVQNIPSYLIWSISDTFGKNFEWKPSV